MNHICLKIIFRTKFSKSDRVYACYLWFVISRTKIANARRANDFSATSCLKHSVYIKIYDLQSRKLENHFDFVHVNSKNSFLSLWMWSSKSETWKRTLCAWYMRSDVSSKIFSSFFNDNSSWKLNFLILSWFTKYSITSKLIMIRRLCSCESTLIHTSMKMWLTTSFFSIRVCKTKIMFINFDFFSHIWDQFCWMKSSILIVHNFVCHNYNKWFRLCVYSTTIFYDEERLQNVRRSCVISA